MVFYFHSLCIILNVLRIGANFTIYSKGVDDYEMPYVASVVLPVMTLELCIERDHLTRTQVEIPVMALELRREKSPSMI